MSAADRPNHASPWVIDARTLGRRPGSLKAVRLAAPVTEPVVAQIRELYAYPDSATAATTDDDEVERLIDDLVDLEPVVRDEVVLSLPLAPLCRPDCAGLCVDCGERLDDLEPGHSHEILDPRWDALREKFTTGTPQNAERHEPAGSGE